MNILLVEDGRANQILAIALLKKWGHSIVLAENGQQAIDLWAAGSFDLILMDVQMPVMDGLTATHRIREQEHSPDRIPIIAMTARAVKGDRESCLEAGMDAFVSKPMKHQALHDALVPFFAQQSAPPQSEPSNAEMIDWDSVLAGVENDESILEDVIRSALEETARLAPELESALNASDAERVQRHAHTIKSTSQFYGATTLTECAETIETAASDSNLAEVQLANQRFQQLCKQFLNELHDHLRS